MNSQEAFIKDLILQGETKSIEFKKAVKEYHWKTPEIEENQSLDYIKVTIWIEGDGEYQRVPESTGEYQR